MGPRPKLLIGVVLVFAAQMLVPRHALAVCPNGGADCGVGAIVGGEITDPSNFFLTGTYTGPETDGTKVSLETYELSAMGTFDSQDPIRSGSGRMEIFTRDATGGRTIVYSFAFRFVRTGPATVLTSGTSWAGEFIVVEKRFVGTLAHQEE